MRKALMAMWRRHRPRWLFLVCCAAGMCVPLSLGLTYSERLSSHQGFYQVAVQDTVTEAEGLQRPRRTVLVVFDGLGHGEAEGMASLQWLRERGQCRRTDVSPLSLSRPVYAVLSTGLEQDRTGARNNDDESPLAAESIWQIARAAGLSVAGVSELKWWQQLFPSGFSTYLTPSRDADFFRLAPPADLLLIHPIYIDEAGHTAGAGSQHYRDAVARGDRELMSFLATLDLRRDLIVVTADHGHALRGGHGGLQLRIAQVLSCYAGRGVLRQPELLPLRAATIAPSLALLMGRHFPAHMRAGDDDLDALWSIADPAAFPAAYLTERRQAVAHFRAENQAALRRWLPLGDGSWSGFYAWHRGRQVGAAMPFAALILLGLFVHRAAHLHLPRGNGARHASVYFGWAWMAMFGLVGYALQVALRGSFDMSSIQNRLGFILFTVALALGWATVAVGLHFLLRRRRDALGLDLCALCLLGAVASVAHPVCLGWKLGFPLPPPALYFFPYFAALFLTTMSSLAALLGLLAWRLDLGPFGNGNGNGNRNPDGSP